MYKKLNLTVSSSLVVGLFLTGCSQQQISGGSQQSVGGQQVYSNSSSAASGGVGRAVLDGSGNAITDGYGGIVRDTIITASNNAAHAASYAADMQTAPIVKPMKPTSYDHQVQDTVVPRTPDIHHHDVRPTQHVRQPMAKPVQRMAKPIQRQSVAYTNHSSGMPPAKPGQCYAKVRTGPMYKNVVKRVQVSPATNAS